MIGDIKLEEPKTVGECLEIFKSFGFKNICSSDESFFANAYRLIELNNEVYEKRHSRQWLNGQLIRLNSGVE